MKKDTRSEKFLKYLLGNKNEHTSRARRRKMKRAIKKFKQDDERGME